MAYSTAFIKAAGASPEARIQNAVRSSQATLKRTVRSWFPAPPIGDCCSKHCVREKQTLTLLSLIPLVGAIATMSSGLAFVGVVVWHSL